MHTRIYGIYEGKINGDANNNIDRANIEQSASGRWKASICNYCRSGDFSKISVNPYFSESNPRDSGLV